MLVAETVLKLQQDFRPSSPYFPFPEVPLLLSRSIYFLALFLFLAAASPVFAQVINDPSLDLEVAVSDLSQPSAMAFYGPGDFLVLEKDTGRVVNVVDGVKQAGFALDLAVQGGPERGLLGVAVHPDYPSVPRVYLFYTPSATGSDTTAGVPLLNRVERYTFSNGTLSSPVLVHTVLAPAESGAHLGGPLLFGPDKKLYLIVGDRLESGGLQNDPPLSVANDTGVIFRMNDDGSAAPGNPLSAPGVDLSKYYAYGIRNSFGIAFDPVTGVLWETENGIDGYDELNLVAPGFNSGWNVLMGPDARDPDSASQLLMISGGQYSEPEFSWNETVVPTGLAFLRGSTFGAAYEDSLVVATYSGDIFRFRLNAARNGIVSPNSGLNDLVADPGDDISSLLLASGFGGISDLKLGPDGHLYGVSILFNYVFVIRGDAPLSDVDGDGRPDALDNCPNLANADQADTDGDAVGNVCDNCTTRANPRVAVDFLTANPWATLTGGQRDDDHDGYGNACDAKFPGVAGTLVGTGDLAQFRTSNGKSRSGDTCGTLRTRPCAIFDLDETGLLIGTLDLTRFRLLNGKAPGPKCPTCPLTCSAGTAGTCQ
jgi:glucose/arabinose dehydrogenase